VLLLLLVAAPAVVGTVLVVGGRRMNGLAPFAAVSVALVEATLSIVVAFARPSMVAPALSGISAGLAVDSLSAILLVTVAGVFLAVIVFAAGEIGPGESRGRFFGLMLVFVAAMFATVTATTIFTLLAAWEMMGATSYALIGFWWPDADRVRSASVAFITTRTADLGMYLAAGAALAAGASGLQLSALAGVDGAWRDVALAGLVLAALGKSAQLPFSFWLSHAMAGPSPVSALLHSATMVAAGGYLLLRIEPGLETTGWLGPVVAWIGALTALMLAAVAVAQRDLKQLLAASTCSQIGFIVLAAGAGGVSAGTGQFIAQAVAKSLLFLVAGAWMAWLGTKDLVQLRGAAREHRLIGITFTVGALTLGGIPPFSIWVAKDLVLSAVLPTSGALYGVGLAASALSAAYAAKALAVVWARPAPETAHLASRRAHGPSVAELLPLPVLAAAAAGLGVLAIPALAGRWQGLLQSPKPEGPAYWELGLSALLAAAVLAVVVWLQTARLAQSGKLMIGADWLSDWLGLERFFRATIVRPTVALAKWCARFDDRVIAGGVDAAAMVTLRSSRIVEARLERGVAGGVSAIVGSIRRLAVSARRPQTGLIHQYYAQSIVIMVALAAVFVLAR
jgi:NADH-quinone oxidoreductase subunit L